MQSFQTVDPTPSMVKQAACCRHPGWAWFASLGKDGQRLLSHQVAHLFSLSETATVIGDHHRKQDGKHKIGQTTATY
jgi:hypothetical protein